MKSNLKVAVLGGGSWATAIAKIISENVETVGWYMRNTYAIEYIKLNHHNPNYLSYAQLDASKLDLSNDINSIISNYDVLIVVIPSAFITKEFENVTVSLENKIIFSAVKGIVPETGLVIGDHLNRYFNIPMENIGVIAGPCHAEEVAMERLSYLTLACEDKKKAKLVSNYLSCRYIKTIISNDVVGIEYGSMLKNIYAIAAGIAHGLGYGDNFQAVLMSNAIREMKRFIKKVYKTKRNINNSAYLGDLLVTGYSVFSRNRTFGNMIGKGYTTKSAILEMNMVAEGYYATESAKKIIQEIEDKTPIINAVYNVLYDKKDVKEEFRKLADKMS